MALAFKFKQMRKKSIDPYKIVDKHPITNNSIDLKWYRGANRYNNGATRYGQKYQFRYIISSIKQKMEDNGFTS
jgi:hypothetical protein